MSYFRFGTVYVYRYARYVKCEISKDVKSKE